MPANVSLPESKNFDLPKTDELYGDPESGKTTVDIKQARLRENKKRGELFKTWMQEITREGNTRTIVELAPYDLIVSEVFLTMVGCNLTVNSKPAFRFGVRADGMPFLNMNEREFLDALAPIQDEILMEIHEKVLEMNPHWRFNPGDIDLGEGN